jgi:hypothetical protein
MKERREEDGEEQSTTTQKEGRRVDGSTEGPTNGVLIGQGRV